MTTDSQDGTEAALRSLLAEVNVGGAALAPDTDLPGAGLTSLKTVDLMLAIEDRFGVEFPEKLLNRRTFATLANLVEAVEGMRAA